MSLNFNHVGVILGLIPSTSTGIMIGFFFFFSKLHAEIYTNFNAVEIFSYGEIPSTYIPPRTLASTLYQKGRVMHTYLY